MEREKEGSPTLAECKGPAEFSSLDEIRNLIVDSFRTPVFFSWNEKEFVINGDGGDFNLWSFGLFDGNTGFWPPVTSEFEDPEELFDLPFLDGKSLRERFAECRFFVE